MAPSLAPDVLERAARGECTVAQARVVSAEIRSRGSRSEAAVYELAIESPVHGESPSSISVWRYTSGPNALQGGRPRLAQGATYLVAFEPSRYASAAAAHALVDFVAVS
jgi:hypothetical protein